MDISLQFYLLLWISIWISLDFDGYLRTDLLWILGLYGRHVELRFSVKNTLGLSWRLPWQGTIRASLSIEGSSFKGTNSDPGVSSYSETRQSSAKALTDSFAFNFFPISYLLLQIPVLFLWGLLDQSAAL